MGYDFQNGSVFLFCSMSYQSYMEKALSKDDTDNSF